MAHRIEVCETDEAGNVEVVGAFYFCSDECAKGHPGYSGWNGACDAFTPVECSCGKRVTWYRWNFETHDQEVVLPDAADYWETY